MAEKLIPVSLKPTFINFEETGPITLEGKLTRTEWIEGKDGSMFPKYTLIGERGPFSFLGTIQLTEALAGIPNGTALRINFKSVEKLGKHNKLFDFDIEALVEEKDVGRIRQLQALQAAPVDVDGNFIEDAPIFPEGEK